MLPGPATPFRGKQAPNALALGKTATLSVASQPLSTSPMAQVYLEPGINVKLTHRKKPKVDFTFPEDLPKLPLDFVPTNKTPGANGEEPARIVVKEGVPADLMDVFARISAEEKLAEAMPKAKVDVGTELMKNYTEALREVKDQQVYASMLQDGFTQTEAASAMEAVRMERAIETAKKPPKAMAVQTVLEQVFPKREMETQTEITAAGGKEVYARAPRRTAAEVAMFKAIEASKED